MSKNTLERFAPMVQRIVEDDDLRKHAKRSLNSGRDAVGRARGRKATVRPSVIRRSGDAVAEAGRALVALSKDTQPPPRRRGRRAAAALLLAGVGTGAALWWRDASSTTSGGQA